MENDIKYRYNDISERYRKMNCFYVIESDVKIDNIF